MKKNIVMILAIGFLLTGVGCSQGNKVNSSQSPTNVKPTVERKQVELPETKDQKLFQAIPFGIVAESQNSISSQDKEKVIKDLEDQLGTLLDSINESEGTNQTSK